MDLIDKIIEREGKSTFTNDPLDKGGRTQYGISEKSNPEAWVDGRVDYAEARRIYARKYLSPFTGLESYPFYEHLVDFGVTSGPVLVVSKLQEIVGAAVDGRLGPETLDKVSKFKGHLDVEIVKSRIKMIGRIVTKDPSQLKYLNGWLNRTLEFLK